MGGREVRIKGRDSHLEGAGAGELAITDSYHHLPTKSMIQLFRLLRGKTADQFPLSAR